MEDGKITKQILKTRSGEFDLESIHTLNLRDLGVTDLGCIGECTGLERLNLSRNDITKLTKLAGLVNLTYLNLSANRISSLGNTMNYLLSNKGAHLYNGNIFTCTKCKKEYKTEKGILKHECTICPDCKKIFSSRQKLKTHVCCNKKCVKTDVIFRCLKCKNEYKTQSGLENHRCNICLKCEKTFSTRQRLNTHSCCYDNVCQNCKKTFSSQGRLKQHKCKVCVNCGKNFNSQRKLTNHNCSGIVKVEKDHEIKTLENTLLQKEDERDNNSNETKVKEKSVTETAQVICISDQSEPKDAPSTSKEGISQDEDSGPSLIHDVEILQETTEQFHFFPVTPAWQKKMCETLNMQLKNEHNFISLKNLDKPFTLAKIKGDGNCFFRAVSYLLCGDEELYPSFRSQLVWHMISNETYLRRYLPGNCNNIQEYIIQSNILLDSTWATEVEIYAASHLLNADIYIYTLYGTSWKWLKYCCRSQQGYSMRQCALYLQHTHGNHFDVVTSVTTRALQHCSEPTKSSDESTTNYLLQKYFAFQKLKHCERQNKSTYPVELTSKEKRLKMEMERNYKVSSRAKMSLEKKSLIREKERQQKAATRSKMTPVEKKLIRDRERQQKAATRDKRTPELKHQAKKKERNYKLSSRTKMTTEKKSLLREKERQQKAATHSKMTPVEKKMIRDRERQQKAATRDKRTPELKHQARKKERNYKLSSRNKMTPEKKSLVREKERQQKAATHSKMTHVDKKMIRDRERQQKAANRNKRTPELKHQAMKKERNYKLSSRNKMTHVDKKMIRERERQQKAANRNKRTPEKKTLILEKERRQKSVNRSKITLKEKNRIKEREKRQKSTIRSRMTPDEKHVVLMKERQRKIKSLKRMTSKEKQVYLNRKRQYKSKSYDNMSPEQKRVKLEKEQKYKSASRKKINEQSMTIESCISKFKANINKFPDFVCTSCRRLLYGSSVTDVNKVHFINTDAVLLEKCLTKRLSVGNKEWICDTCKRYLHKNQIPPQSNANMMHVEPLPEELIGLSPLERRLVSQRYPFMKLLALPRGKQSGIKGVVVNVPVDAEQVCTSLPLTPSDAGILPLKLKRKIQYKGHHKFEYIRPVKVKQAFLWLKDIINYIVIYRKTKTGKQIVKEMTKKPGKS